MNSPEKIKADTCEVASPCVGVCALNDDEICAGCGRSLDEIAIWPQADSALRAHIVNVAAQRMIEEEA